MSNYNSRNADKFVVRLPEGTRTQITQLSDQQHISMNSWIVQAVDEKLARAKRQELLLDALEAATSKPAEQKSSTDAVEIDLKDLIVQLWSSRVRSQWDYSLERGVKITHVPSGITVTCDTERSMYANKNKALGELQSQLAVNPAPDVSALVEALEHVRYWIDRRVSAQGIVVTDALSKIDTALAAHRKVGEA